MATLITEVAEVVAAYKGNPDIAAGQAAITAIIQQYLTDNGIALTPKQWAIENQALLTSWALPSLNEFITAWAKARSGEEPYATDGAAEINQYALVIMAVVKKFEAITALEQNP